MPILCKTCGCELDEEILVSPYCEECETELNTKVKEEFVSEHFIYSHIYINTDDNFDCPHCYVKLTLNNYWKECVRELLCDYSQYIVEGVCPNCGRKISIVNKTIETIKTRVIR